MSRSRRLGVLEVSLGIGGVLLALSAPLLRPFTQPVDRSLSSMTASFRKPDPARDGALFAVISGLHSQIGRSTTPEQALKMIASGCDVHGVEGEPPVVAAMGGADPLAEDAKGRTPLDVAKVNSHKEMVELLLD